MVLFFYFFFIFLSFSVESSEEVYLIKNLEIIIEDNDLSVARDKAKEEAFEKGLEILIKKITPDKDHGKISFFEDVNILDMIKDYQIKKESFFGPSYKAVIDVNFVEDKIDEYLSKLNLSKSNIVSESILVLPVHYNLNNLYLWEKNNEWYEVLENEYDTNSLLNLFFPERKYLNQFKISAKDVIDENKEKLEEILFFYKKRSAIIIFYSEEYDLKNEVLNSFVDLKFFSNSQIEEIKINSEILRKHDSKISQIDLMAKFTINELNNWWKNKSAFPIQTLSTKKNYALKISFNSLRELKEIEEKLSDSGYVESLKPQEISKDYVIYKLISFADFEKINLSLRTTNLSLFFNEASNNYEIKYLREYETKNY